MLAGENALLRAGVRRALERGGLVEVVAEELTLAGGAAEVAATRSNLLFVAPWPAGTDSAPQLQRLACDAPAAVVATLADPALRGRLPAAVRTIPPGIEPEELALALVELAREPQAEARTADASGARLTQRELEVLAEVAHGRSNREIGRALGLSEHTVKFHLARIYRKLRVRSRTEAASWLLASRGP